MCWGVGWLRKGEVVEMCWGVGWLGRGCLKILKVLVRIVFVDNNLLGSSMPGVKREGFLERETQYKTVSKQIK